MSHAPALDGPRAHLSGDDGRNGGELVGRDKFVVGDLTNTYAAIGAGASLIVQKARSRVGEIKREERFIEERLADGLEAQLDRYRQMAQMTPFAPSVNPYRALKSYEIEHAGLFYGRAADIEQLWGYLNRPLSVVRAESGAGKSSLLKAGLASRLLAGGHLPIYLRPIDRYPSDELKAWFAADFDTQPGYERLRADSLTGFLERVTRLVGVGRNVVILIDQFEEFFYYLPEGERKRFAAELADCVDRLRGSVRWMFAIRDEKYSGFGEFHPAINLSFQDTYDKLGNFDTFNKGGEWWDYTYWEYTSRVKVVSGLGFGAAANEDGAIYDGRGNLTKYKQGNVTYTLVYDVEGRLTSVTTQWQTQTPKTTIFYYDADGNRTRTVYPDGGGDIYTPFPDVEMAVAGGETTWRVTFSANGQAVAQWVKAGATVTLYSLHTNHLGSVVAVGNAGGGIVTGSYAAYEPFGAFLVPPTGTNPSVTDRGFTGHRHNNLAPAYLGLVYMNARYYHPQLGRFVSPDSIVPEPENPQSYNRFSYVNNNPLVFSDPSGHCLQYATEQGNSSELEACLQAWNRLGGYYSSLKDSSVYPIDYMTYLLEKASTDDILGILGGFGVQYTDPREHSLSGEDTSAYIAGSIAFGIGVNAKFTLIIDRFGNIYLYSGGEVGLKGPSGSLTHGWVNKGMSAQNLKVVAVDEALLESLLSGWSISAGGGFGVGASFIGPFGEQNKGYALTEAGLYYPPQVGAGGGYSVMLYDSGRRTNKVDKPSLLNSRFEYWYRYYFSQ